MEILSITAKIKENAYIDWHKAHLLIEKNTKTFGISIPTSSHSERIDIIILSGKNTSEILYDSLKENWELYDGSVTLINNLK